MVGWSIKGHVCFYTDRYTCHTMESNWKNVPMDVWHTIVECCDTYTCNQLARCDRRMWGACGNHSLWLSRRFGRRDLRSIKPSTRMIWMDSANEIATLILQKTSNTCKLTSLCIKCSFPVSSKFLTHLCNVLGTLESLQITHCAPGHGRKVKAIHAQAAVRSLHDVLRCVPIASNLAVLKLQFPVLDHGGCCLLREVTRVLPLHTFALLVGDIQFQGPEQDLQLWEYLGDACVATQRVGVLHIQFDHIERMQIKGFGTAFLPALSRGATALC
jgi:hypothetical protein